MFLINYFTFVTFFVIISGYVNGDNHEECGDDCKNMNFLEKKIFNIIFK